MAQAKRAAEGKLDSRKASVTRRPSSRSLSSAKSPLSTDPVTGASLRKVLTHVCKSNTCGRAFETTVREKEYCSPQCGNRERQRQQRCRHRDLRLAAEKAEGGNTTRNRKSKLALKSKPKPKPKAKAKAGSTSKGKAGR